MQKTTVILLVFLAFCLPCVAGSADTCLKRIEKITNHKERLREYDAACVQAWLDGRYDDVLTISDKGIVFSKKHGTDESTASLYNNLGIAYDYLGKYSESLEAYFEALRLIRNDKKSDLRSRVLSNIGLIYANQGQHEKALSYYNRALAIDRKSGSEEAVCAVLNNIAIIYVKQKKFDEAIKNYEECIRIDKKIESDYGLGDDYNNIAVCYLNMQDYEKAMYYLNQSLEIRMAMDNKLGVSETYTNIASVYVGQNNFEEAKKYFLLSVPLSQEMGSRESLKYAYENLAIVEEKLGNEKEAFRYYKEFISVRDSLQNLDQVRRQTELELNYEHEKERELNKLKQARKEDKARAILYAVISVAGILLIFFILLFQRWKTTKRQQKIIEEKTALVQQKNQEILDSIAYAKRIQTAILPASELMTSLLPSSFILYKPKDIVAGDFYWLEETGQGIYLAVADCTGHGVPGALMSVVCHNALNRSLREFNLTSPAAILNKTREIVIHDLSKDSSKVNDGMDVSLCCVDLASRKLTWSGANHNLWVYRRSENQIEQIKGDKQPIGLHHEMKDFQEHQIKLQTSDRVFMFTDGLADQFGGEKGKKLMSATLKNWVTETAQESIAEQGRVIESQFISWKGSFEQVDDICAIGFEVN